MRAAILGFSVALSLAVAPAMAQQVTRCPAQLPAKVAAKRDAILAAAKAGDLAALAKLTSAKEFTYSFGEGEDALRFWRDARKQGTDVAKFMVAVFQMGCTLIKGDDGSQAYSWPSASEIEWAKLDKEERVALEKLYGRKIDEYWLEGRAKGYYVGWRGAIDENGEWRSFVAGD